MCLSSRDPQIAPPRRRAATRGSGWHSFIAFTCLVSFLGLYTLHAVRSDQSPGVHHGKYQKVQVERLDNLSLPGVTLEPVAIGLIDSYLQPIVSQFDRVPGTLLFRDHPTRAPPSLHP
jgi:hypothetical protein